MQRSEEVNVEGENESVTSRRRKMFNPKRTGTQEPRLLSDEEEEEVVAEAMLNNLKGLENSSEEGEVAAEEDSGVTLPILRREDWKLHWGIKCHVCSEMYTSKMSFEQHYHLQHGHKPMFQCAYCNKIMDYYSTFRSHRYRHITEGRFRCEHCKKGFSVRSLLRVHVLSKHAPVKPYICETCGRAFGTRPGLNLHLEKHTNTSTGGRQWPCEICGKVLLTSSGHKAHMAVHQQGKRFMCELCGKTFTQKVNMQQHFKGHSGEKPYQCDICGKGFAEKSHLNRHHSFHSDARPFRCNVCHKMYKTERCLKVHAMTHGQERPCICSYCGKGFLSNNKLKQHYNIHTGERPYVCKFCQRTFTNYPNYLKHTRRRHKVEMAKLGVTPASLVHMNFEQVPGTSVSMQSREPIPCTSEEQLSSEHKFSQGDLAVVAAVAAAAVAQSSMQTMDPQSSSNIPHVPIPATEHLEEVMLTDTYIKYEPLDMSPLPRDPLEISGVAGKLPDLTTTMPSHMHHQMNPYHQYQDPFLC